VCPTCTDQPGYSRITDEEMKRIMKNAVDHVYKLLCLKKKDPKGYEIEIREHGANWACYTKLSGRRA
jgi:hypothetical protein